MISGDPFDNSQGFLFPAPEGTTRFPPNDPDFQHLLQAQAHIPPTELSEAAGFTDICGSTDSSSPVQRQATGGARLVKQPGSSKVRAVFDPLATTTVRMFGASGAQAVNGEPDFCQFDVPAIGRTGAPLPPPLRIERPDGGFDEFRNEPIRDVVIGRINANESYRAAFKTAFPDLKEDEAITFAMFGQAIAEFEFSLTFMNAPIDRYARGEPRAMSDSQKRGALVFFNKANCVQCLAISKTTSQGSHRSRRSWVPAPATCRSAITAASSPRMGIRISETSTSRELTAIPTSSGLRRYETSRSSRLSSTMAHSLVSGMRWNTISMRYEWRNFMTRWRKESPPT